MSKRIISPNLTHLYTSQRNGYTGAILEGSSRSTKTWSSIDNIIRLCSTVETNATFKIVRSTYNSFKTTLYEDFNRRLPMFGIPSPFQGMKEVSQFELFGNTIHLLGANNPSILEGGGSDYVYFNELLDIEQVVFDSLEQRCRKFWWGDYNPKFPRHWVYDKVNKREDVAFLKTTFLDNPYISKNEKRKILSYEPWHPDDRHLPENLRRPHPINVAQGTADEYRWKVYGLGTKASPEGLIYKHVTWVTDFPADCEQVHYGVDFGFTISPTALVKVGIKTIRERRHIFLQVLHYAPTPTPDSFIEVLKKHVPHLKIDHDKQYTESELNESTPCIIADSAAPGYISDARKAGFNIFAANKYQGSLKHGIGLIRNCVIHLVDCDAWQTEQAGYCYMEINGLQTEEPEDAFNHAWDAVRYVALRFLTQGYS